MNEKRSIYYYCKICNEVLYDSDPKFMVKNDYYCGECAFKNKMITSKEYINCFCFSTLIKTAKVYNGEIYLSDKKDYIFQWERKKENRFTKEYKIWRKEVFERDKYKCVICEQVGGELNAHHIKKYSEFPDLRLDLNNGITLCEECHKLQHRKK